MKISTEAEQYADSIFFNSARLIQKNAKQQLLKNKFVSHEDTAQTDYTLQIKAAAEMGTARMESYVTAYEFEGEQIEHDDVLEFIQAAKKTIETQSNLIPTVSGGIITMVRNQWSDEYREQMLNYFREKAFILMEPSMNDLILRSKEAPLKKARRKKMSKRDDLFRWIFEQCGRQQYRPTFLRNFLDEHSDWTEKEIEGASDFLTGEGLIEQKDDSGFLVWLTHKGVKAGESGINIEAQAQQFVQHTQNIFHGSVGAVQQGNNNSAIVSQNIGAGLSEVATLLAELRNQITAEHEDSANDYIDALEEELKKEEPKESRVRLFLNGIGSMATEAGKAIVGEVAKKLLSGEAVI